jgi:hypothetical protein
MRILLLISLIIAGCSAKPDDSKPLEYRDANEAGAKEALEEAHGERADIQAKRAEVAQRKILAITEVELGPEEPRLDDTLEASALLRPGHSPFAEIEYTWYVNGKSILGVSRDTLDRTKGRWAKRDRVYVVAVATDEHGAMVQMSSNEVMITNSTPSIITDIRGQSGLNGLRLQAEDPDGDKLTWSITDGPPGVTINSSGVLRVDMRNLKEAYNGEVVIAAEDPDGARAELHIPVNVNAATEGTTKESKVNKRVRTADGTLDEYEKVQEKGVERMESMTDKEFKKYMDDQEKNADR